MQALNIGILSKYDPKSIRFSLVIGFIVAILVLLLGPYTGYSASGFLDPWIPTGYFTNFNDMIDKFGIPYYVTRLPYILPGLLLYTIFDPFIANFLLNLSILGICCTALYIIAIQHIGIAWSVSLTIIFAINPYMISTVVWDYPDGASIAYFMVGLALLCYRPIKNAYFRIALIGIVWAMSGFVNLIAGLIILPGTIYLLLSVPFTIRDYVKTVISLFIGVLFAFLIVSIFSHYSLGIWNFLGPQLGQYFYAMDTEGYLGNMWGTDMNWLKNSFRLVLLIGPIVIATPLVFTREYRNLEFIRAYIFCGFAVLLFIIVEFYMHAVVLRVFYHSSYLIPIGFMMYIFVIKNILYKRSDSESVIENNWIFAFLAVLISLLFMFYVRESLQMSASALWWLFFGTILITIGITLVKLNIKIRAGILALVTTLIMNYGPIKDSNLQWVYRDNKSIFDAAMHTQNLLTSGITKNHKIRFWFDEDEDLSYVKLFHSINSLYLWGYRNLTAELPILTDEERAQLLPQGIKIIHLTSLQEKIFERTWALEQAGINTKPAHIWKINGGDDFEFFLGVQDTKIP